MKCFSLITDVCVYVDDFWIAQQQAISWEDWPIWLWSLTGFPINWERPGTISQRNDLHDDLHQQQNTSFLWFNYEIVWWSPVIISTPISDGSISVNVIFCPNEYWHHPVESPDGHKWPQKWHNPSLLGACVRFPSNYSVGSWLNFTHHAQIIHPGPSMGSVVNHIPKLKCCL